MKALVFILSASVLLTGCWSQKDEPSENANIKVIRYSDVQKDFAIPTEIWQKLQAQESSSAVKAELLFTEIEVYFSEKNPGVLQDPQLKMIFPKGGGKVDLADVRGHKRGTYYFAIRSELMKTGTQNKVFLWSKSKQRRIGQESFGAGCGKLLDITDRYFAALSEGGIKVNSTEARDTSLLGGVFFFVSIVGDTEYISQVTVEDSHHPELFCEE